MYQHDPRHVDVLVKDLGLEHGNSVQKPAARGTIEEEESEPLRNHWAWINIVDTGRKSPDACSSVKIDQT